MPRVPRPARDAQVLRSLRSTTACAGLAVGLDHVLSSVPNIGVVVTPEQTMGYSHELLDESEGHRVTRHRLEPGAATGWHHHDHPYVVVPITAGSVTITSADGKAQFDMRPSEPYSRPAGVEHSIRNTSPEPVVFVEVEYL